MSFISLLQKPTLTVLFQNCDITVSFHAFISIPFCLIVSWLKGTDVMCPLSYHPCATQVMMHQQRHHSAPLDRAKVQL